MARPMPDDAPVTNATLFFSMKDPVQNAEQVLNPHLSGGLLANPAIALSLWFAPCIPSQIRVRATAGTYSRCPKREPDATDHFSFCALRQRLDLCVMPRACWVEALGLGSGYHQGLPVLRRMFARCRTA